MIEQRPGVQHERAVIVGMYPHNAPLEPDRMLDELASLAEAAGAQVVGRIHQKRHARDAATYIGKGKVDELATLAEGLEAQIVIFDGELSPSQIRELEAVVRRRVIDRSELILDIFASRARTREAILQVELAQLQYTAPRLRGMWTHLERQAGTGGGMGTGGAGGAGGVGGIGTRGPGEKQIEIDRRIVSRRISRLREELAEIDRRKTREVLARTQDHFTCCLVGYTNAGKSTLMNRLTGADVFAADMLFATLDTRTRRWDLAPGEAIMLSDTVGFVRDLPHQLVASFRATLEEALHSDLLLHVIDASHPHVEHQIHAVEAVLTELKADMARVLPVLNKIDAIADPATLAVLRTRLPRAVLLSAQTGQGVEHLHAAVRQAWRQQDVRVRLRIPMADGRAQSLARARGRLIDESWTETCWEAHMVIGRRPLEQLYELAVEVEVLEQGMASTVGLRTGGHESLG